jgi:hypothetical protein
MLRTAATYLLPEDLPLRAPLEMNDIIEAASNWLGLMPSANPSAKMKALGVHYYRAAFMAFVKLWSEYGNVIFSGVGVAGYHGSEDQQARRRLHVRKNWVSPGSSATDLIEDNHRRGIEGAASGDVQLVLILSATGCMVYNPASMLTEGAVVHFGWNEVVRAKIVGITHSNVDIDLGDARGRVVIRCFSAGQAIEIVASMHDHTHALLRRGRGSDQSAIVSSWWLKFHFGELPPAPSPLSLQQIAHREPDAALDSLVALVLAEARARNMVCAQIVCDIETICSRIAANIGEPAAPRMIVHGIEIVGSSVTPAATRMYVGEFAKVLKYLDVLPEDVAEGRVAEVLDPESTVGIDYNVFCARFRALLDV